MSKLYTPHPDFGPTRPVTKEQLDDILEAPVLHLEKLTSPIIIESMELLFNNGMYYVRTRTKCGLTGIAPTNDRVAWCYPILNELVIPYFIGKDARDLEKLIEGVYVYKSNYKLAGLPFWCSVAFVELSILDLLGKAEAKREAMKKEAAVTAASFTIISESGEENAEIEAKIQARQDAKKAKNFAEADRIRDELKAEGIELTDIPHGAKWKRI